MAITIGVKREHEFTATNNNSDPCIFPRVPANHVFVQAFNFDTKNIAVDSSKYLAFPFVTKIGSTLVGIYSDGDAHASSDRQMAMRSSDGITWTTGTEFYNASSGLFDTTWLSDLLPNNGDSVVLKAWTVKRVAGVLTVYTNSTVAYGGLTYALWSRAIAGPSSKLYRTGYAQNGSDTQTALFESSDAGQTWSGVSVMFSGAGRLYSEADLVNTSGTNWLAVCREDSGASNPLYLATSTDDGATWSAATLFTATAVNGRQPNLTKTTDGSIILATGDRSGASGYASSGEQVSLADTTGVTVFRSTDNGSTWGYRTRISPMYSSDGGQPMINETTANRICAVYYSRRTIKQNPIIASARLDIAPL